MLTEFSKLQFEEKEHTYTLEGRRLPSVSKTVSKFYEPFDSKVIKYSAIKHKTTVKKLATKWKRIKTIALTKGNRVHDFAEAYAKTIKYGTPTNLIPTLEDEFKIVEFFFKHRGYEIVGIEQRVYSEKFEFAGTFDLLLKRKDKYIIVDWKTNKDVYKNYKGKTMLSPFSKYLDQPISKYFIQLSLYQICLEEYGYNISERWVYWTTTGELIKTPDLTKELKLALK